MHVCVCVFAVMKDEATVQFDNAVNVLNMRK